MLIRLWFMFGVLVVTPTALAQGELSGVCNPSVSAIKLEGPFNRVISERMRVIFDEDQAARMGESIYPEALMRGDAARRVEVMGYLNDGKLTTRADMYYAAFVFQHGNCSEHYKLANRLAARAIVLDHNDARWIYAATLDRYLLSRGERQKFGTQYTSSDGCTYALEPVDPGMTDTYRALYGVPSLAEAEAAAASFAAEDCPDT